MHGKEDIFCPSSKFFLQRLLSNPSTLFIKMPTYADYLANNHASVRIEIARRV